MLTGRDAGGGALTGIDAEIIDEHAARTGRMEIHDVGVGLENICEDKINSTASSALSNGASSSGVNIGSKKKKRGRQEVITEDLSTMNENLKIIAAAIQDSSERVDMDQLMTTLMTIPDFDDRLIIESVEFLLADKKRVDMFFSLNEDLRKKWLLIRLRDA